MEISQLVQRLLGVQPQHGRKVIWTPPFLLK